MPSLLDGSQYRVNASLLYLPDSGWAAIIAFSTSLGDDLQSLNTGRHFVNPRKSMKFASEHGARYSRGSDQRQQF